MGRTETSLVLPRFQLQPIWMLLAELEWLKLPCKCSLLPPNSPTWPSMPTSLKTMLEARTMGLWASGTPGKQTTAAVEKCFENDARLKELMTDVVMKQEEY